MLNNIEKFVKKGQYIYAIVRGHPKATPKSYVLAHRAIAENEIGRYLLDSEVVHHINGNKKDNRPENLQVMDKRDHIRHHVRQKGSVFVNLVCPWCKKEFSKRKGNCHLVKGGLFTSCSDTCRGRIGRFMQLYGITESLKIAFNLNVKNEYIRYLE